MKEHEPTHRIQQALVELLAMEMQVALVITRVAMVQVAQAEEETAP